MSSFAALIHNENIKIYSRLRTWIMLFLLVLISFLFPLLIYITGNTGEQDISMWDSFQLTASVAFLMNMIFTVVIASDAVAGEFGWGTIKLLLIRPWSRSKILLSKYISMVLFSLVGTALFVAVGLTASLIFSSSHSDTSSNMAWTPAQYSFLVLLCQYVWLFIIATLAFMVSSVFRASGLAIGLSLFITFAGDIITAILNPERYSWAKFLIFPHMNLNGYILSDTGPGGVSLGFSIGVLAVYYVVFMAVSWLVFCKRDVSST